PRRIGPRAIDPVMYGWRHLVQNFFCALKEFKRAATCSDKTDDSYRAMILIAAAVIHSRD
ncbi:MAG: transposase, partial [Pseudomonadota bacterium]